MLSSLQIVINGGTQAINLGVHHRIGSGQPPDVKHDYKYHSEPRSHSLVLSFLDQFTAVPVTAPSYLYIGHVGQWEKCYGYLTV
jgi:hypothetical protein